MRPEQPAVPTDAEVREMAAGFVARAAAMRLLRARAAAAEELARLVEEAGAKRGLLLAMSLMPGTYEQLLERLTILRREERARRAEAAMREEPVGRPC